MTESAGADGVEGATGKMPPPPTHTSRMLSSRSMMGSWVIDGGSRLVSGARSSMRKDGCVRPCPGLVIRVARDL